MFFEKLKTKIIRVALTETDDGYGGITREWAEVEPALDAYIQRISSTEQQVANKVGEVATYYITTSAADALSYHDVVRRVSDGTCFRVLSDGADMVSPSYFTHLGGLSQVTAERWETNE